MDQLHQHQSTHHAHHPRRNPTSKEETTMNHPDTIYLPYREQDRCTCWKQRSDDSSPCDYCMTDLCPDCEQEECDCDANSWIPRRRTIHSETVKGWTPTSNPNRHDQQMAWKRNQHLRSRQMVNQTWLSPIRNLGTRLLPQLPWRTTRRMNTNPKTAIQTLINKVTELSLERDHWRNKALDLEEQLEKKLTPTPPDKSQESQTQK